MSGKHAKREDDVELEKVASQEEPEEGDESPEAVVEEFRQFIDQVSPEDFAS